MTLRCQLCGNVHFREDDEGNLWCRNCGAGDGPPAPPSFDPGMHDLTADRAEDEAALRDMECDFTGGLRREQGGW